LTEEDLVTAIELMQGRVDIGHASAKLREMHGWRGQLGTLSGQGSREVSVSPGLPASTPHTGDDSIGVLKLTAALDEIILRNESRSKVNTSPQSVASVPVPEKPLSIEICVDEPMSKEPSSIERRPSRTRIRSLVGLEMTSIRSRSLDTDDRI
jgi:hypothetical protein